MEFETKINEKLQVVIPSDVVKKYDVEATDIVEWKVDENGNVTIKFKKIK